MEYVMNYIKPELMVVSIALYFIGMALKKSTLVKDNLIPLTLGGVGVVLCVIYVLATTEIHGYQSILMAIFVGITQGFITAGSSVYVDQLVKQYNEIKQNNTQ